MRFVSVPGYCAGDLSPAHTLNDHLDRLPMPGQQLNLDQWLMVLVLYKNQIFFRL